MPKINLYTGYSGLHTKVDPTRIPYDPDTGISALSEAVNVTIDDSNTVSRRPGQTLLQPGSYHSLFCDTGDCFVVQERVSDAAIFKVNTDYSLTGVRSGLTKNKRMSMCQINSKVFYSNTVENGFIENGISEPWPDAKHVGPESVYYFANAPLGKHIEYYNSRIYLAKDNVVWYSERFAYGKFRPASGFIQFSTDVKMIKAVATGLFISDSEYTYFFKGTSPLDFTQETKQNAPAHEWSVAIGFIDLQHMDLYGQHAVWSSDKGLCIGTATGEILVFTERKLNYPNGVAGATVINGLEVINSVF